MNLTEMLFQSWEGVIRTVLVGILAYVTLVIILRISGKRTLAKLNAFDLVVTVALGSTLSAILLQESVALAEGATALALLVAMQYAVTFTSVRSRRVARFIRSEPALLVHEGVACESVMKKERITASEAVAAVRAAGGKRLEDAKFLVLESDGTLSATLRDNSTDS